MAEMTHESIAVQTGAAPQATTFDAPAVADTHEAHDEHGAHEDHEHSHGAPVRHTQWGMTAEFDDVEPLLAATQKVRDAGYRQFDAYSPFPIEGLAEAVGKVDMKVPYTMLGAGFVGLIGGFAFLQWTVADYPLNIGGRPLFQWPSFIPITFELTVLMAALCGIGGMIVFNGLPLPYHPVFNAPNFDRASTDRFFIAIEAKDPHYDPVETRKLLESLGALNVAEIQEDH